MREAHITYRGALRTLTIARCSARTAQTGLTFILQTLKREKMEEEKKFFERFDKLNSLLNNMSEVNQLKDQMTSSVKYQQMVTELQDKLGMHFMSFRNNRNRNNRNREIRNRAH